MASLTFVVTHACSFENVSFSSYGICRVNSNFFGFLKNKSVIVWLIDIISFHKDASLKMYLLMSHLKSDLSPPCLPFPVNAFFFKKIIFCEKWGLHHYFPKLLTLIFHPKASDLGDPDKMEKSTLQECCSLCSLWKVEFSKFFN